MHRLKSLLRRLNRQSYKHYKNLKGDFLFPDFVMHIDFAQADPFASLSKITINVKLSDTGFPKDWFSERNQSIPFRDALARVIAKNIRKHTQSHRGTGHSGLFAIHSGGQEILDRNSVLVDSDQIRVRLLIGLPAYGRQIAGEEAEEMFFRELPLLVKQSLYLKNLDRRYFESFIHLYQKQEWLRRQIKKKNAIAFVANGSKLARASGVRQTAMENAVPFQSPPSLEHRFELPNGDVLSGMLIPKGVTLITGGGFHGKSTLLSALQNGIYNHIPGDGREYVISDRHSVKIRAEEGRNIVNTDLSSFISDLPGDLDTRYFSTNNASGSTSQAANIVEALEAGARVLLIDEDTSATNFLIRDRRMQELVQNEPISPYINAVRMLSEKQDVSTVMVTGGSGDYLDVADLVLLMDAYRVQEVSRQAKAVCERYPTSYHREFHGKISNPKRVVLPESLDASKGKKVKNISAKENQLLFGKERVDLSGWEQLTDPTQVSTIGEVIYALKKRNIIDGKRTLFEILDEFQKLFETKAFEWMGHAEKWNYACEIRPLELMAALNRFRSLKIKRETVNH